MDRRLYAVGWSLIVGGLIGLVVLALVYAVLADGSGERLRSPGQPAGIARGGDSRPAPGSGQREAAFDDTGLDALEDVTVLGGTDVPAGLYRVMEPVEGDGGANRGLLSEGSCKWGLYEGAERGIDQIKVANVTDGGHPVMRIADGQRAYTQNCGAWELMDEGAPAPGDLATAMDDGYWVVGIDIAPGTYRRQGTVDADNPDTWCTWTVHDSFEPGAERVSQGFDFTGVGPSGTDLTDGQVLSSSVCGGWERVG